MTRREFRNLAKYCEETYGSHYDEDEAWFICPECGEPIYFDDWAAEETADWSMCPICEINLYEDVE